MQHDPNQPAIRSGTAFPPRWIVALVLILFGSQLTLSGCLSGVDPTPGSPPLDPEVQIPSEVPVVVPLKATFAKPVKIDPNRQAVDVHLATDPDGTIYVCSPENSQSALWRSIDGGQTFQMPGNPTYGEAHRVRSRTGDLGGVECDLAVDAAGGVYLADGWIAGASVSSSTDRGGSWSGTPTSALPGLALRPWVVGGNRGEVFLLSSQGHGVGLENQGLNMPPAGGVWVARSTDGGQTFAQHVQAVPNENRLGYHSNLVLSADKLHFAYTQKIGEGRLEVRLAVSSDRGLTWTQHAVAQQSFAPRQCSNPVLLYPVMATDGAKGVYVSWVLTNPTTGRLDLFLASSPDEGETWTPPTLVTDRPGTRAYPWLSAGRPGQLGLTWYETNASVSNQATAGIFGQLGFSCTWGLRDGTQWFLHYASVANATGLRPDVQEVLVQPEPVNRGKNLWPPGDLAAFRYNPQGLAVVAYVSDFPNEPARPLVAVEQEGGSRTP